MGRSRDLPLMWEDVGHWTFDHQICRVPPNSEIMVAHCDADNSEMEINWVKIALD